MTKLDEWLDTQARNQRFAHYDLGTVLVPFQHAVMLNKKYRDRKAAILADPNLTGKGKADAADAARTARDKAIREWNDERLKNIDGDLLEQKAALRGNVNAPEQKRVDLMASHLLKHAPEDIAAFYDKATDTERIEMEAASASVGRVPIKGANGREWKSLLDPKLIETAILERAAVANPAAAQKVRELSEIRSIQTTATAVALSEI